MPTAADDLRPSPDALLKAAEKELRGKHKIFLGNPAVTIRIGVDLFRIVSEVGVDFQHCTSHWRVNIRCRLDRFHDRHLVTGIEFGAHLGQFDIDQVTERRLRVIRNADGYGAVLFLSKPFMFVRVQDFTGQFAHGSVPLA